MKVVALFGSLCWLNTSKHYYYYYYYYYLNIDGMAVSAVASHLSHRFWLAGLLGS